MKFIEIIIDNGEGKIHTIRVEQEEPSVYHGLGAMAGEAADEMLRATSREFRNERKARKAFRKSPLGQSIKRIGETLSAGMTQATESVERTIVPQWPAPGAVAPVDEMRGMRPTGVIVDEPYNDVETRVAESGIAVQVPQNIVDELTDPETGMVVINPNIPKTYPHREGDTLVLGPETFTDLPDKTVISHAGENYNRAPSHPVSDNEQSLVDDGDDGDDGDLISPIGLTRDEYEYEDEVKWQGADSVRLNAKDTGGFPD